MTNNGLTEYEKACYLLALYKGALVVLEIGRTEKEVTLLHLVETIVVGQEMVLDKWEKEQEITYQAKVAELIQRIGSDKHMVDVATFLSIMRRVYL